MSSLGPCGSGQGGISNLLGKLHLMHWLFTWCLSLSNVRSFPSCVFCANTVCAMNQTSLGWMLQIIPASNILSTFVSMNTRWSGLYDPGGIFVLKVAPFGMFNLCTAPGMALISLTAGAKKIYKFCNYSLYGIMLCP